MPRPLRTFIPGVSSHVYLRAINGAEIFHADADYAELLELVRWATVRNQVDVHAYAVMRTHYHLVATPESATALARAMKQIDGGYVRYYNRKHSRTGTVWCSRYCAKLLTDQRYFWNCFTYVERNPVEAGIVGCAEDYKWSSYRFHAYGAANNWLTLHPLYDALGSTPATRQAAYRSIFHTCYAINGVSDGV